jgi:phosphoserine phosphatase
MNTAPNRRIFISHPTLSLSQVASFKNALGVESLNFSSIQQSLVPTQFADGNVQDVGNIKAIATDFGLDVSVAPIQRSISDFKLAAFDMDSTLITIECIDEIADYIGKKAEVAAITEAAMRGEITDYQESLRRRVALLKGLPVEALQSVYDERLKLTAGAESLVTYLQQSGVKILLVSGGFTFFTEKLKQRLQLDFARSNQLEIADGKLTGALIGEIVDAQVKRETVLETCRLLDITAQQVIAIGDGANDLNMMAVAKMSVAFHAKPIVQAQASDAINFGGLDTIVSWLRPVLG